MKEKFVNNLFKEFTADEINSSSNIIKAKDLKMSGKKKVEVEHEEDSGVKIVFEKNEFDEIKEIKFYCSCGQTKSIILDYSE